VQNFFEVPWMLEKLIILGCFVCLDAFLYVVTYLPIRVLFSLWLLLNECWKYTFSNSIIKTLKSFFFVKKFRFSKKSIFSFHRTHIYDLMRGAMILIGCSVLMQINMSVVYHYIRGQNMIKLYVLTSMMEVRHNLLYFIHFPTF
jgi:hypothetical protein